MGRWSRKLGVKFVSWLDVPTGAHWLDVGCGTGALASAIVQEAGPATVVACDPSAPFIANARSRLADDRVTFVVAGSGDLPARPGGYGSIASLLSLNFIPDCAVALQEMASLSARGATVSACVWDYGGKMELLRLFWDAATGLDPAAHDLDEGRRFPICEPESLVRLFQQASFREVQCEALDLATEFADFDDYWGSFLGGTGPAPSYVASLSDELRSELAAKVERVFSERGETRVTLVARAWAVRGTAR